MPVCNRLLFEKKKELGDAADKLRNGLSKIDDTREKVEKMSVELEDARVKVAQFQKQCDDYLVIIVQQKREADEQQKVSDQRVFSNAHMLICGITWWHIALEQKRGHHLKLSECRTCHNGVHLSYYIVLYWHSAGWTYA